MKKVVVVLLGMVVALTAGCGSGKTGETKLVPETKTSGCGAQAKEPTTQRPVAPACAVPPEKLPNASTAIENPSPAPAEPTTAQAEKPPSPTAPEVPAPKPVENTTPTPPVLKVPVSAPGTISMETAIKNRDLLRDGRQWNIIVEDTYVEAYPVDYPNRKDYVDTQPIGSTGMEWELVDAGFDYPVIHITYGSNVHTLAVHQPNQGGGYISPFVRLLSEVETNDHLQFSTSGKQLLVRIGDREKLVFLMGINKQREVQVKSITLYPVDPEDVTAAYMEATRNAELYTLLAPILRHGKVEEDFTCLEHNVPWTSTGDGKTAVVTVECTISGVAFPVPTKLSYRDGKWMIDSQDFKARIAAFPGKFVR